jgi:DNA invertase Pin-like site-specific DNA recombinase
MQVAIYTRISRDRAGASLGVERQAADCRALADRLGWAVVDTYSDNDVSAYSGRKRTGYEAMCAAIEAGRIQGVVAWHTDRLHRRPVELESFIDLCERKGVEVRTVHAGTIDLSTASGKMVARMLGAAARHEVEHSIERQKRAKQQAAVDGKYRGGRRPFGYEPNGMTERTNEADAIRSAANDVLAGKSLSQIAREWNAAGLRTSFGARAFTSMEVAKILKRPRNAGIALHGVKRLNVGQWDAILDGDTFAALEAMLTDPRRRTSRNFDRKYQGSGVYLCGRCGKHVIATSHNHTRSDGWRRAYACSGSKHLTRDVAHVDAYIDSVVIERLSRPDAPLALHQESTVDVDAVRGQRDGVRARLDELTSLFAAGSIDGDQLAKGSADLRARLESLDAQIASARSVSALADFVLAGDDLAATWTASTPTVRGKVIDALMIVTLLPATRGRKAGGGYFDPDSVRIEWKASASKDAIRSS